MNQIKLILQFLILISCLAANSKSVCVLIEKEVERRQYSFKCNSEVVKIQCKNKDEDVCGVTIQSELQTMKFNISDDELESLNLFSKSDLTKTECDSTKKLCMLDKKVCKKYENVYEDTRAKFVSNLSHTGRCSGSSLGASINDLGVFSGGIVSETEFTKNNCSVVSGLASDVLKNKVSIFAKSLESPMLDRTSFLYQCVKGGEINAEGNQDSEVLRKVPVLNEFKKALLSKLNSPEQLKEIVCSSQNDIFFENNMLNIDNVICAVVEESVMTLSDKTISYNRRRIGDETDRFTSERTAKQAGAALAKADTVPLESKPMPQVMADQVGKPIGLTPALAQVDQAVPGSVATQGAIPSEGNIASGAVRTISTSAAMQAGAAFAPVYEKLSNMANSVSASSGRTSVIGRSNSTKINSDASGVVTVSRKLPASGSGSSVDPNQLIAASGSAVTLAANNTDGYNSKSTKSSGLQRSTASNSDEAAPVGGPRPISLTSSRSAGSGSQAKTAANVMAGAANSEIVSSAALAAVQQKITELNTPAKIESFFKKEASTIPDLRSLLYSDAASKLLASKGIRVVNQSGDISGESMNKAKYVFSDDGTKFTKLTVSKKN